MNKFKKLLIGLVFVLSLTGCFGESYDFSPPTVKLSSENDIQLEELAEANIDWHYDEKYNKETKDIQSFAKKQNKLYFNSGQKVILLFQDGAFDIRSIRVSIWQNDKKLDLELKDDQSIVLPKDKGEYVLVVDLNSNSGSAQFVGNIHIIK